MNIENYKKIENEIYDSHKLELHKLRTEYVEKNKKFNVGDFVFNVTGIIKVDKVSYEIFFDNIDIVYSGYRYKKVKNEISRTKDKKISYMWESHNLKLLT
ncbi:hypothetical protein M0Q97_09140 [Candidatus Dojkabacteria bacterium]|jgi:hypothetical protein|nr:hypothetical protein [Candidatus Dojkabacteria bacterium]